MQATRAQPRRTLAAWSMFDWANSAFATLVVTFVYSTYFTTAIAADEVTGTAQWSRAVGLSGILVAVLAPPLGALADRSGRRLACLGVCTLVCCVASAGLTGVHPDWVWAGLIALSLFVVANVAFELSTVFYNAFLPELVPAERVGRLSGWAWGLGYAGGLLSLVLALAVLAREQPLFGISTEAGFNYRAVCLLAAGWFALFSLPLFVVAPRQPSRGAIRELPLQPHMGAYRELSRTFRQLRHYPDITRLLVARLLYNDGLITIFAFGGIYAAGTFGMSLPEVIQFGIALNVTAGIGACVFGVVDDRLGGKRTILVTLVALTVFSLLAVWAPSVGWLWLAGLSLGLFVGPNQSASRTLMSRFVPEQHSAAFFGLFAFSGKITTFAGPLLLGIVTQATGSQRLGVATVVGFFVLGGLLLLTVDERRGIRTGQQTDPPGDTSADRT